MRLNKGNIIVSLMLITIGVLGILMLTSDMAPVVPAECTLMLEKARTNTDTILVWGTRVRGNHTCAEFIQSSVRDK